MAIRRNQRPQISASNARRIWLHAQKLDQLAPFGDGPEATRQAVEHLGYVQIDTINVIERCHHHILHSRIPTYRREDLHHAQSIEKSVFEYWTHALSYVPTRDIRFFLSAMKRYGEGTNWFASISPADVRKLVKRIEQEGPLSIRDIEEDKVEKTHAWASRKPSKRTLELAFYQGKLAISKRSGMVKTYELMHRHFGWENPPRPASDKEVLAYLLNRALTSQGIVSLDSICHLDAGRKPDMRSLVDRLVKKKELVQIDLEGAGKQEHWVRPEDLEADHRPHDLTHILSPFDPLIIQRKRLKLLFDHDHLFEAYVPKEKRVLGYFALPVLIDDKIVAALDLKTDRQDRKLIIQSWTWFCTDGETRYRRQIETALHDFEAFQLA